MVSLLKCLQIVNYTAAVRCQIISIVQLLFYAVRTFWQVKNTAYLAVSGYN